MITRGFEVEGPSFGWFRGLGFIVSGIKKEFRGAYSYRSGKPFRTTMHGLGGTSSLAKP